MSWQGPWPALYFVKIDGPFHRKLLEANKVTVVTCTRARTKVLLNFVNYKITYIYAHCGPLSEHGL